jgi:hypothetical protein
VSSSGEEPAGEDARAGIRSLCPHCGAVCEPDQEYCLSCGERLFETGIAVTSLAERWRNSLPFADKDWAWPVLISLTVAILASTVAIAVTGSSDTKTLQELGPSVRQTTATPTTTGGGTSTGLGTTTTTTTTTTTKPPKPLINAPGLIRWPGPPAYTIVLASIPISGGKASARQKALEAINAGLGDVGVLKSSDFSSLHPGYFVVFAGVFKAHGTALGHLSEARKAGFASAYPQRVAS